MWYSASNPLRRKIPFFRTSSWWWRCCGPSCGLWLSVQLCEKKPSRRNTTYHYQSRHNYLLRARISVVSDSYSRVLWYFWGKKGSEKSDLFPTRKFFFCIDNREALRRNLLPVRSMYARTGTSFVTLETDVTHSLLLWVSPSSCWVSQRS